MSDTTTSTATSAPTPLPAETVIDPAPVHAPTPVGSQAPDKPVDLANLKGSEPRPPSRREALQAAFAKAEKLQTEKLQAEKASPKLAPAKEANPGSSQAQGKAQQPQDPQESQQPPTRGRFAPREPQAQPPAQPQAALPETAPYREPPPRLSDKAKAEWAAAPESIRGDVHRMTQEFEGAYKRYRGDHEAMNAIRPYHELATRHGTTLDRALNAYVGMEQKLRADPLGGLEIIVGNLDLRTPDGQKLTLRDIAHHVVSQTPEQLQMRQASNAQTVQSHQMAEMRERMNNLEQREQRMLQEQARAHALGAVNQFAETHPRLDELGDLVNALLPLEGVNYDLATAYEWAEKIRGPSPHAAQTRTSTTAQTRPADKSISGAPENGPSNGSRPRPQKPVGRREAVQNAIRRVNGSL
jgi:hypothetical protein